MNHRTPSGIIPISLGLLLAVISFIDIASNHEQLLFSAAVILCGVTLVWYALRHLTGWTKIAAIFFCAIAVVVSILLSWSCFHPAYCYPITGPVGDKNRAFIADIGGLGSCELLVSASEWPYTFARPFVLGDIFENYGLYESTGVYWSSDGSVMALKYKPHGRGAEFFEAAYDFRGHHALSHCSKEIADLIQARGGLGPRSDIYSESNAGIQMDR